SALRNLSLILLQFIYFFVEPVEPVEPVWPVVCSRQQENSALQCRVGASFACDLNALPITTNDSEA
ncbi:MAG: hypothetical protein PVF10_13570, partial [Syntrophobacterales bacterium]